MLHPICGFVASLQTLGMVNLHPFGTKTAPKTLGLVWTPKEALIFWVRFAANSAFCSLQMILNLTQRRD